MQHYYDKNAINWTWVYIWQGRRSFGYDTIAEAAMTHMSYVNKSNRLYKQHHNDKNAINWTWVYIVEETVFVRARETQLSAILWSRGAILL